MGILKLKIEHNIFDIELLEKNCPITIEKLKSFLPFRVELHYAKIAGEEIMAVMPFHAPLENPIDVAQANAGMLAFWPHRHLLCLYYGEMQEEAASINVLGYLKSDTAEFAKYGEKTRGYQGKRFYHGDFFIDDLIDKIPELRAKHEVLHRFELEVWQKVPSEILQLGQKSGIMRPAGPVIYAEKDSHVFHENLNIMNELISSGVNDFSTCKVNLVKFLDSFYNKMRGWYQLKQTAEVIECYHQRIKEADNKEDIKFLIDHLMLFVGRINLWIDALIPWNEFNEYMKKHQLKLPT